MIKNNVKKAITYAKKIVGTPYSGWTNGDNTRATEIPFWITGSKLPAPAYIKARSCNCAGMINLMRRSIGLSIPGAEKKDYKYAGGTYIWFHSLKKEGMLKPFDIRKSYPAGTLLLRNYKSIKDQGHVAVIFERSAKGVLFSKLLHCYMDVGVAIDAAVGKSHFWDAKGYYTHICLPQHWLGEK